MFNYDIIQATPHNNLILYVKFHDKTEGYVQLINEKLTGVLSILRNDKIFKQVYVESGVVCWPGDIDLSPKSMYDAITQKTSIGCLKYKYFNVH